MRLLLDTNIIIPLEPGSLQQIEPNTKRAVDLVEMANRIGVVAYVHPEQVRDIARDRDQERRQYRGIMMGKYSELPKPPRASASLLGLLNNPAEGGNDWVDSQLIAAVVEDAVDFLVTEDRGIHRRCSRLGYSDRCFGIDEALLRLRAMAPVETPPLPAVKELLAHEVNREDPIFETLRSDYSGFDAWFSKCRKEHRRCWVVCLGNRSGYAGLAIVNPEHREWVDADNPTLKLCTFKVSENSRGGRLGELLLRAVFYHARENGFRTIFVEAYPKQVQLVQMLGDFGFAQVGAKNGSDELVLRKRCAPSGDTANVAPLDYHRHYGPFHVRWDGVRVFVVPIEPRFHDGLFPDLSDEVPLFAGIDPFGNTLRKAYLCNSPCKRLREGDLLLFYRSKDVKGITTAGVVEQTLRTRSSSDLCEFMSNRTVYSPSDISRKIEGSDALAIRFYHAPILKHPLPFALLKENGILKQGPQSICEIPSPQWIRDQLQ